MYLVFSVINCGPPPKHAHTSQIVNGTTFGKYTRYTCNPGYRLSSGSEEIRCNSNGLWDTNLPYCRGKASLFI